MNSQNVLTITTYDEAKEIYRHKDFKQALYDAGEVVMEGVLVNLHGDEHRARRRSGPCSPREERPSAGRAAGALRRAAGRGERS